MYLPLDFRLLTGNKDLVTNNKITRKEKIIFISFHSKAMSNLYCTNDYIM